MLTYLNKYNQNLKARPNFGSGNSSALDAMVERLILIRVGWVVQDRFCNPYIHRCWQRGSSQAPYPPPSDLRK
jgi:hypothetical protein